MTQFFPEFPAVATLCADQGNPTEGRTQSAPLHFRPLPDSEDDPRWNESESLSWRRDACSFYERLLRQRSGIASDLDDWEESKEADDVLLRQSHDIAHRLEASGVRAWDTTSAPLALVDPMTGEFFELAPFRRVNFLPSVSKARRNQMLLLAETYLENKSFVPYHRFITVTNGPRVPLDPERPEVLRSILHDLHRKLGRFNSQDWAKEWGLEMILRSTEFGALVKKDQDGNVRRDEHGKPIEWRDESGRMLMHPHAHCIVRFTKGKIPRPEWRKLLSKTIPRFFGAEWDAGKEIENLREALKYPLKPCDLGALRDDELAALFHATFRMRFVSPLGHFAEWRNSLIERKKRPVRMDEGIIIGPNWNRRPEKSPEGHAEAVRKLRVASDHEGPTLAQIAGPQKRRERYLDPETGQWLMRDILVQAAPPERKLVEDMVVARLAPAPYFGPISRPVLLVAGYTGRLAELQSRDFVKRMIASAEAGISARPISLDTTHLTSRKPWAPAGGWRERTSSGPSVGAVSAAAKPPESSSEPPETLFP